MIFSCICNELIDRLQVVTKALASRTTNTILEGLLIRANADGTVVLTCTDEHITIVTRLSARVDEPGAGVVPGKLFNEIVRRFPTGEVRISTNNRNQFRIQCGASRINVAGQDADLFPMLPQVARSGELSLPQSMLKEMIQKTEFAIAQNDVREILNGSCLDISAGEAHMVALDGYRMALYTSRTSDLPQDVSVIIPGRAVSEIAKLLSDDEDAFVRLTIGADKLHIDLGDTDVYVILVQGQYLDWRRIVPKTFATTVTISQEALRQCVDRAALFAREGNNNLLIFRITENRMLIEAHSQMGDVREELDVETTGSNVNIAFNVRYIQDVVRYMDSQNLVFHLNSAIHPCVISPEGDDGYIQMVLPIRTAETR